MFRYIGIVTHHRLDDLGINSGGGMRFLMSVQTGPRAYPVSYILYNWYLGLSWGVKQLRDGTDHPPISSKGKGKAIPI
jgi:hypothetical protein